MAFIIENGILKIYRHTAGETEVIIPDGVTKIGEGAFSGCTSLTSVTIPNSVTEIGDYAFSNTPWLENLCKNNNGFGIINNILLRYIGNETDIIIPDGVTEIGYGAFYNCTSLTSITIPNSVTEIGWNAFEYCTSLKSITIPDGVTKIGYEAFWNCTSLKSITIPNSVTEIGSCAFLGCTSLKSVTIPNSVTEIGGYAFENTPWLKNLCKNNNGFGIVNNILLRYKGNGTDIIIPDGVTEIREEAFRGCKSLTSITIPDSVTKIGEGAFSCCTSLTSVTIPNSVTEIGVLEEFKNTPWFENLCKNNKSFVIINNILLKYKGNERDVVIPNSVIKIGGDAFRYCTNLTSITIPDGVTEIGSDAFENCSSLKSITIPDSVTEIGRSAFSGCTSPEKVITPDFEIKVYGDDKIYEQICLIALKDFSLKMPYEIKYKIIWQMFMQKPNDKETFAYVKKNFIKMIKYAIDNNNVKVITAVCKRKNLLTKKNIDKLIEYAIQHTQNGGTVEIQAILMRYKNDNIGYSEPNFSI